MDSDVVLAGIFTLIETQFLVSLFFYQFHLETIYFFGIGCGAIGTAVEPPLYRIGIHR